MAKEPIFPLSLLGVYLKNSVISSYYQSIFLSLFGVNNVAWRLSNIILIVPLGIFSYLWIKTLTTNKWLAVLTVFFLAFSSLWANFFKIGYINPQASVFFVLNFYLFEKFIAKPTLRKVLLAGLALGLGFYIYVATLLPFIMIPLYLRFFMRYKFKYVKIFIIYLLLALALASNGIIEIITKKSIMLSASNITGSEYSNYVAIFENMAHTFLLFFHNFDFQFNHFVYGPYVDIVSQGLILIGILAILARKNIKLYSLLGLFITTVIALSLTTPYVYTPTTRNYVLLIFAFVFAAYGLLTIFKFIYRRNHELAYGVLSLILASVVIVNVYKSVFGIANYVGYHQKALVFREVTKSHGTKFVLLKPQIEIENWRDFTYFFVAYQISNKTFNTLPIDTFSCTSADYNRNYTYIVFLHEYKVTMQCIDKLNIINDKYY